MKTEFYKELEGDSQHTHAKMIVHRQDGGTNYFSGGSEQKGIYVVFKKVAKDAISESFTLFANDTFKICIHPTKRHGGKVETLAHKWVTLHKDEFLQLYISGDKQILFDLIKQFEATKDKLL